MKRVIYSFALLSIVFASCEESDSGQPLKADFDIVIEGEAPNAQLSLVNNSTSATTYEWEFSEGTSIESSTAELPTGITVDKSGDLTITLTAIDGTKQDVLEKSVTIEGNSAIVEIIDLEFSQTEGDDVYGRSYSINEQAMYLDSDINESNGGAIDLIYYGDNSAFIYFETPDGEYSSLTVPNAKTTKINNSDSGFEVSVFDSMIDDAELSSLTVENDDEIIGSLDFPLVVTFETQEGKKGAIKLKAINSSRLLVDIKVQKY
ncbi:hypothetical protein SAMN04488028_101129 [Reichenbachiella agariperforans]|uniref:PKD domain-containing protein n=1 Tax=Reichenbachiella agariperforans TaxID=156994 RepID=A0A1M6JBS9_REIAG|nr:PKD domain-containing protein [Reichenbachiella agariperforans]SHJ44189.1 hypothetical protein SAMN04488028_101129 [Reichenbachiella agariperforans]